jgi:hypothetical protein
MMVSVVVIAMAPTWLTTTGTATPIRARSSWAKRRARRRPPWRGARRGARVGATEFIETGAQ